MKRLTSTAIAALLAAPFAIAQPALAQTSDSATQSDQSTSGDQSMSGDQAGSGDATSGSATQEEQVIVTVDGTEITTTDVTRAVAGLPPQMQQTPAEQLVPFVVEQLVLRELIVQDAEEQGITGEPPESASGDGSAEQSEMAQQNATIEAYMEQQMEGVVTDEAVQSVYEDFEANATGEVPPLEDVRPQIEQQLRQQKLAELRTQLMEDVEIVYYGPDGEPRETSAQSGMSNGSAAGGSGDTGSDSPSSQSMSGTDSGSSSQSEGGSIDGSAGATDDGMSDSDTGGDSSGDMGGETDGGDASSDSSSTDGSDDGSTGQN